MQDWDPDPDCIHLFILAFCFHIQTSGSATVANETVTTLTRDISTAPCSFEEPQLRAHGDANPPEGNPPLVVVQWLGTPDRSLLARSVLVRGADLARHLSSPAGVSLPSQQPRCTTSSMALSTIMEFLRGATSQHFCHDTVEKMQRVHHPSSVLQYNFCWSRLQNFP